MELLDRIAADLKESMLARDTHTTATLRIVKAEIQKAQIAAGNTFDSEAALQVIRREVKKRSEAVESYKAIGALDRVAQEEGEAVFLSRYLPAAAEHADIEAFITSLLGNDLNKGELIKKTIEYFKGTADGKFVAATVNRLA